MLQVIRDQVKWQIEDLNIHLLQRNWKITRLIELEEIHLLHCKSKVTKVQMILASKSKGPSWLKDSFKASVNKELTDRKRKNLCFHLIWLSKSRVLLLLPKVMDKFKRHHLTFKKMREVQFLSRTIKKIMGILKIYFWYSKNKRSQKLSLRKTSKSI